MRARGMFLSLAITAVWLAATSSAGLRPGYEAHRFAAAATVTLTTSLWTPMARAS